MRTADHLALLIVNVLTKAATRRCGQYRILHTAGQTAAVELKPVTTSAETTACHFAFVCKTCGVDTLYLPLLLRPATQTWRAALVLFTHPRAASLQQWYRDARSVLGVRRAGAWHRQVDGEKKAAGLRGPQDGNVSLVKSFLAQNTAFAFTLI